MTTMNLPTRPMKLLVATAAVAAAAAFAGIAFAQPHGGGMMGHEMGGMHAMGGMHGGPSMMGLSERLLDRVNASAEQRTQIRQIMDAARKDMQALRENGRALREQAMQAFAAPTVDANAVERVRQQMLAQHDQASKRMSQAMLEASRVLTPEQRKQLAEGFKQRGEMMERHRRERQALEAPKS
jgi:Spy/CpxP family protein refolding chaperone